MLKRIRRAWSLATKDQKALEKLTKEEIDSVPEAGDGKAVFFPEGSPEDWEEEKKDRKGLKGIFGIGK